MAENFHFLSLLVLLSLLSASPVLSRNLSPRSTGSAHTTATLDVSSSLDQALRVLSFEPHQTLEQEMKSLHRAGGGASSSGGLTLELHSRDFLPSAAHVRPTDYKTLTIDRLRRDSARVKSIAARVALAAHGIKRSDLKPVAEEKEFAMSAEAIRGPIISGTSQGSGEYFFRLGIGSPPNPSALVHGARHWERRHLGPMPVLRRLLPAIRRRLRPLRLVLLLSSPLRLSPLLRPRHLRLPQLLRHRCRLVVPQCRSGPCLVAIRRRLRPLRLVLLLSSPLRLFPLSRPRHLRLPQLLRRRCRLVVPQCRSGSCQAWPKAYRAWHGRCRAVPGTAQPRDGPWAVPGSKFF